MSVACGLIGDRDVNQQRGAHAAVACWTTSGAVTRTIWLMEELEKVVGVARGFGWRYVTCFLTSARPLTASNMTSCCDAEHAEQILSQREAVYSSGSFRVSAWLIACRASALNVTSIYYRMSVLRRATEFSIVPDSVVFFLIFFYLRCRVIWRRYHQQLLFWQHANPALRAIKSSIKSDDASASRASGTKWPITANSLMKARPMHIAWLVFRLQPSKITSMSAVLSTYGGACGQSLHSAMQSCFLHLSPLRAVRRMPTPWAKDISAISHWWTVTVTALRRDSRAPVTKICSQFKKPPLDW